ncbi:hypothetical protein HHK36_026992 [Tetracentron sinense]|uniref:Uncharacterized protein n=1 Tax=Tetracentron sinense TaxID=13715 RepID=A0A834YME1_TETSI|nr:hypothetical protein HHK36_026992 [Tetracentron sinense]
MDSSSVLVASLIVGLVLMAAVHVPQAEARAFFVFGDSLVDSGNNDYLVTTARADSPPYGIDYPTHRPTGRFSNGLNIPDIISERIGSESTLPYLSPELTGERLLVGANFASAGIGILDDTGIQFLNIIKIFNQLEYFQQYQQRVSALIGAEQTQQLVNQALVLITLGGNDFVNNYYLVPFSLRSRQFSLPDFVRYLISEYRKVLTVILIVLVTYPSAESAQCKISEEQTQHSGNLITHHRLYELGARRVLVTGTGPLGCVPGELATRSVNGECAVEPQRAARLFNPQLIQMISGLNSDIGADVFVAVNAAEMHMNFITDPQAYGFVSAKIACCGQGPYNGLGTCTILSSLCPNRDLYAFWDPFHPSERANRIIVQQIFTGTSNYMYPMNLSTIMAMDSRT